MVIFLLLATFISPEAEETVRPQLMLAQRESAPRPPPKSAGKPSRDDFELLPKEATPDAAALARQRELERQLAKRRTMLHYHQIGGFLTVGSLTATVVLGQLDYSDKYGGGGDKGTYHAWHRWVAVATTAIFAGTASLALFAPSPIEKPTRLDSATVHKIAMTVAAAGMVTQIVLGIVTASKEGQPAQRDFALAHQIVGYTTLAASLTGFTVLTF
jgi:hypothetical protein